MLLRAEIFTPWADAPDGREPELIMDYWDVMKSRGGGSITDITGQDLSNGTPNPNMLSVSVVIDSVTLSEIRNDPKYLVVWHEPT